MRHNRRESFLRGSEHRFVDQFGDERARVMALKEIRESYNLMFEKLFDAGVLERKMGTLDLAIRDERKQAIPL